MGAAADLKLWACLLTGPLAWTMQLAVSYPLAQIACRGAVSNQPPGVLHSISAAALAAVGAAAFVSWRMWTRDGNDRYHFMTMLSLLMSGLFGLIVLATWLPQFLLRCEA